MLHCESRAPRGPITTMSVRVSLLATVASLAVGGCASDAGTGPVGSFAGSAEAAVSGNECSRHASPNTYVLARLRIWLRLQFVELCSHWNVACTKC